MPGEYSEPKGSWENDMDKMLPPILEDKRPCYIFFRLDERNAHQNYLWVFMSYTPDFALVKTVYSVTCICMYSVSVYYMCVVWKRVFLNESQDVPPKVQGLLLVVSDLL